MITDMANTVDRIVSASYQPLSIIIVGVGNANFAAMVSCFECIVGCVCLCLCLCCVCGCVVCAYVRACVSACVLHMLLVTKYKASIKRIIASNLILREFLCS